MSQEFYDCISEWADRCGELQKQLAAKEREIERLNKEKDKWAELAGSFTQSHHAKLKEIEGYKQQITHLTSQLVTVREAAIKFAQNVRRNGRWQEDEWIEAGKFLEQAHAALNAGKEG